MEKKKPIISDEKIVLNNMVQEIELPLSPPRLIKIFGQDKRGGYQIRQLSITNKEKMALL